MLTYSPAKMFKRGEIYYISSHTTYGAQLDTKSGRPAIIVSDDKNNARSETVMICYLTGKYRNIANTGYQFELTTPGIVMHSRVKCEQVTTIDKSLVGDYIGFLNDTDLNNFDYCLSNALSLSANSGPVNTTTFVENKSDEETTKLQVERDMYKTMYENLLEKVMK